MNQVTYLKRLVTKIEEENHLVKISLLKDANIFFKARKDIVNSFNPIKAGIFKSTFSG